MIPTPSDTTLAALHRAIAAEGDATRRAELRLLAARALRQLGAFQATREALETARAEAPEHPQIQRSLGLELFRMGQIAEGLTLYDQGRWQLESHTKYRRPFSAPYWKGEALKGRRLLLWAEQGIGDQIMQARILSGLLAEGAAITLEADPRLFPLLGPLAARITCVPQTVPASPALQNARFDWQSSLFSAWRFVENPTAAGQYLHADPVLTRRYRNAWAKMGPALNVGLSWHSRAEATGALRSITPEALAPLTARPNTQFHSLQYGQPDFTAFSQAFGAPLLSDPSVDPLASLTEQAAQIAALDLVITIDNATAHLAGALGVKTWLLLPKGSEWWWGTRLFETALYPSIRLFRASDFGQWGTALWRLAEEFRAYQTP